jgi:hypothetical protein
MFFSEAIALIEPKLCINHWKVLYKLCVFYVYRLHFILQEEFDDTIGVIRICKLKKDRQYNGKNNQKLSRACIVHLVMGLYKLFVFYADRKSKMAATTGHSINTEPNGENTGIYSSLKLLH